MPMQDNLLNKVLQKGNYKKKIIARKTRFPKEAHSSNNTF